MKDTDARQRRFGSTGLWAKMGAAMLGGWAGTRASTSSVYVIDPKPSDWLKSRALQLNVDLPKNRRLLLVAVKPQVMGDRTAHVAGYGNGKTVSSALQPAHHRETFRGNGWVNKPPMCAPLPNTPVISQGHHRDPSATAHVTPKAMTRPKSLLSAVARCCPVWTKRRRF